MRTRWLFRRDGLVPLLGGVLVDERGPGTGMSHPLHQLARAGTLARRHRVAGVAEIVEMQVGQAHSVAGYGPSPPEGRPPQPATLRADQAPPSFAEPRVPDGMTAYVLTSPNAVAPVTKATSCSASWAAGRGRGRSTRIPIR